jgi:hypothetical protein
MDDRQVQNLDHVVARIAYLAGQHERLGYRVWPPASGRTPEAPPKEYHDVRVHDCRPIAAGLASTKRLHGTRASLGHLHRRR